MPRPPLACSRMSTYRPRRPGQVSGPGFVGFPARLKPGSRIAPAREEFVRRDDDRHHVVGGMTDARSVDEHRGRRIIGLGPDPEGRCQRIQCLDRRIGIRESTRRFLREEAQDEGVARESQPAAAAAGRFGRLVAMLARECEVGSGVVGHEGGGATGELVSQTSERVEVSPRAKGPFLPEHLRWRIPAVVREAAESEADRQGQATMGESPGPPRRHDSHRIEKCSRA